MTNSKYDPIQPDIISTPEGDGEFAPDEPLAPLADAVVIPPGSAPHPSEPTHKPKGVEKFVDEIVRGEYM